LERLRNRSAKWKQIWRELLLSLLVDLPKPVELSQGIRRLLKRLCNRLDF
jgi:hypothetical protein